MFKEIIIEVLGIFQGLIELNNSKDEDLKRAKSLTKIVRKRAKLFRFLARQLRKKNITIDEYEYLKNALKTTFNASIQAMKYDVQIPLAFPKFAMAGNEYYEDWSHDFMEINEIWKISKGENAVIFVADTGYPSHYHLTENVRNDLGKNYTTDTDTEDFNGHQTHCTGLAVGKKKNNKRLGTATEALAIPMKVLEHNGGGIYDWIIKMIRDVSDMKLPKEFDEKVRILSLSLAGSQYSKDLEEACDYAIEKGVIIVAAAGNAGEGVETIGYPANLKRVIAVGAIDKNNNPAYFTGRGQNVDLVAPGIEINSTYPKNIFSVFQGTSQATPKVVGFIACLVSALPELRGQEKVMSYLKEHLTDVHLQGHDVDTGHGTIKASKFAADILRQRAEKEVQELPEENETETIQQAMKFLFRKEEINKLPEYMIVRIAKLLSISEVNQGKFKSENAVILESKMYPNEKDN